MRLLWVWLVVVGGVTGQFDKVLSSFLKDRVTAETQVKAEVEVVGGCGRGAELCREGFFFTAVSLNEGRRDGVLEVLLSVEDSLHPNVTFDLSVRSEGKEEAEEVLAREEVTLEVNELRRVVLRVSDLDWEKAYFILKAHSGVPGRMFNKRIHKHLTYPYRETKEVKVSVDTEEDEYAPGDTVDYRVVVRDGNVDKTPKFAQVILTRHFSSSEETRLPWVEVPRSGILWGNFTFEVRTEVRVRVTSNVTSSDFIAATSTSVDQRHLNPKIMSVGLEGLSDVYLSQPRVKGRLKLTSSEGYPLEGHCNVTIRRDNWWNQRQFANVAVLESVAVGLAGREFEFDVVEELGADLVVEELIGASERIFLKLVATCSHLPSGIIEDASEKINFYRSLSRVDLMSVGGPMRTGNSSHPKWIMVLHFLVERNDGGFVEEVEPPKELHVELLLSDESLKRLRPSATNFTLPIPKDGVVRLEFEVSDLPPSPWNDSVRLEVGDAVKVQSLEATKPCDSPTLQLSIVDKYQVIRRGDVVQLRVQSCRPFRSLNSVLFSSKEIFSSHRTSFSSEEVGRRLNELIEFRVPHNLTERSMIFMVYGIQANQGTATIQGHFSTDTATVELNMFLAERQPQIKIIDQVDCDMSTTATFRVEGILADSVVTLQAVTLTSAGERIFRHSLSKTEMAGSRFAPNQQRISMLDDSFGGMGFLDRHLDMEATLMIGRKYERPTSLVFLDVNKMTSRDDNGTFEVTKTFDRLTHFGPNMVTGGSFTAEFGYTRFSNIPTLTILPPPVTLSLSVPPSVILGETFEVVGYIKNNQATSFKGQMTLNWSEGETTEVTEHRVDVKPSSVGIVKMEVMPRFVGDLVLSLKSNISSRLTATQNVRVNSPGEVLKVAKHFILNEKRGSPNGTTRLSPPTLELPANCTPSREAAQIVFQGDILGDISTFVNQDQFQSAFHIPGAFLSHAKVLLSMATFYDAKKDYTSERKVLASLRELKTFWISQNVPTSDIISRIQIQGTKFVGLNGLLRIDLSDDWMKLKSMKRIGGCFQAIITSQGTSSSEETSDYDALRSRKRATRVNSVGWLNFGVIIDTALALFTVNDSKGNEIHGQYLNFTPSDFKRGVEFLRAKTVEGKVNDFFPLSLVTFLVSQINDEDAPTFFKQLESTASKDSDGLFWESKWNGKAWTESLAPSVTATSYALMAYVNMKKMAEADDIARWLVSKKNVNGFYASFEETAAAVESLTKYASDYAAVNGKWPSLAKVTQECVTPKRNVSTGEDFTIQAFTKYDGGILRLKVCSNENNLGGLKIMEVLQPSGYKNCASDTFLGHRVFYLNPRECKYLEYCRMQLVYDGNPKANKIPRGSITYYDLLDPFTRSFTFFEANENEGDL